MLLVTSDNKKNRSPQGITQGSALGDAESKDDPRGPGRHPGDRGTETLQNLPAMPLQVAKAYCMA